MTTHRDTDRLLRSWIDEGIDAAPERAVRDALTTIQATRQRRELALLRRIRPMEITTARPRSRAWRSGALAATVVVLAFGAALAVQFGPRIGSEPRGTSLLDLVAGLDAPLGTAATGSLSGDGALNDLFETTGVRAVTNLDVTGYEQAASASFADGQSPARFTAAVISFADEATAADALRAIYRSALEVPARGVGDIGFWNRPPGAPDPLAGGSGQDRIELAGTWVSFGGTSAPEAARAALLLAWRVGDLVYVSAGIDPDTVATAALQAQIETGVRELAVTLDARSR